MTRDTIEGKCHDCGTETKWGITHALVRGHGITHCLRCDRCGKVVPEFAWNRYQYEGRVVIPL